MEWQDMSAGTKEAAEQNLWVALGRDAGGVALRINSDPEYLKQLAKFAANPWPADKGTTTAKVANRTWASGLPKNES
jgi:hypothetical protein